MPSPRHLAAVTPARPPLYDTLEATGLRRVVTGHELGSFDRIITRRRAERLAAELNSGGGVEHVVERRGFFWAVVAYQALLVPDRRRRGGAA